MGVAAHTSSSLNTAEIDSATTALRALVEHRDDLVKTRTQTINRLHTVLTHLIPGGASRDLNTARAAEQLRTVRPRDTAGKTLRALAADLISELRGLDRRIDKAVHDIETAVKICGTTLTELHGIGALTAAKIVSRVGSIHRLDSPAAFASYTGTAPNRSVVRRRRPAPAFARRRSSTQLLLTRHGHHPDPTRHPGTYLLPAQTRQRQESQRSDAVPQKATFRQRLPTITQRRQHHDLTQRGATLLDATSHCTCSPGRCTSRSHGSAGAYSGRIRRHSRPLGMPAGSTDSPREHSARHRRAPA